MLAHRQLEGALRRRSAARVARRDGAQRAVALERELGVDGDRARRVGQLQQAVDARAGRQRRLECVGRRRQRVLHQVVQLHLAEGAARLLVGQDLLQAHHLGREIADLLLRLVDADQPLAQVGDDLAGRLLAPVEPLGDHLGQRLLLLAQRTLDPLHGVGQRLMPARLLAHGLGLGLSPRRAAGRPAPRPAAGQRRPAGRRQDIHCHLYRRPSRQAHGCLNSLPCHHRSRHDPDVWLFDLDNTLYPARCNLFAQIDVRIGRYISDWLKVDRRGGAPRAEAVLARPRHLDARHDEPARRRSAPLPQLRARHRLLAGRGRIRRSRSSLAALPGRKIIFTAGDVPHAEKVHGAAGRGASLRGDLRHRRRRLLAQAAPGDLRQAGGEARRRSDARGLRRRHRRSTSSRRTTWACARCGSAPRRA